MRRCISLNELQFYIDSLKDFNIDISSHDLIISNLALHFDIETDIEELERLNTPLIEEEDIRLQMKNLGFD